MKHFKYIAMSDYDELFMPKNSRNLSTHLINLEKKHGERFAFTFTRFDFHTASYTNSMQVQNLLRFYESFRIGAHSLS